MPGATEPEEARPRTSGARFLGDAAPVAGIPLSRIGNGLCYVLTGVALLVGGATGGTSMLWGLLLGLFCVGYGVRILLTRGSYWISSAIYVGALFAVGYAYYKLSS